MDLIHGDCLEEMKKLPDGSVDLVLTDPPYGLSFMGKKWDYDVPTVEIWTECLRVLKPGGYLLAFAGTRTQHRMAVRIEDAGFEIRDMIFWTYASGFPKSTNIYKQFQKMCTCGNMEAYDHERTTQKSEHNLRPLQQSDLPTQEYSGNQQREVLQSGVSEQGVSKSGETASNVWGEEPSLEGRSDLQEKSRELQGSEVRPLSASVPGDGEEGRICDGAQIGSSTTPEHDTQAGTGSASQRPQPIKQFTGEPCSFCKQYGAQEVRRRASEIYGFGSALKPACEPITIARKPLSEKNLALNVLKYGTGGLNIDGCRVNTITEADKNNFHQNRKVVKEYKADDTLYELGMKTVSTAENPQGRFPANLIHDGSEEVVGLFPHTKTNSSGKGGVFGDKNPSSYSLNGIVKPYAGSEGSAARFFYCAKASNSERNRGCEGLEEKDFAGGSIKHNNLQARCSQCNDRHYDCNGQCSCGANDWKRREAKNHHPTVKPIALMEYLVTLASREGATILDPFMGSGTTGIACKNLNRNFIGIELDKEYYEIACKRIQSCTNQLTLVPGADLEETKNDCATNTFAGVTEYA